MDVSLKPIPHGWRDGWRPSRSLTPRGRSGGGEAPDWITKSPLQWKAFGSSASHAGRSTGHATPRAAAQPASGSSFHAPASSAPIPMGNPNPPETKSQYTPRGKVPAQSSGSTTTPRGWSQEFNAWSRPTAQVDHTIPTGMTAMSYGRMGTVTSGSIAERRGEGHTFAGQAGARGVSERPGSAPMQTPRKFDRTWAAAGSRLVSNVLTTPRARAEPPVNQEYGGHRAFWARSTMPASASTAGGASIESLTGAAREEAMRRRANRERLLRSSSSDAGVGQSNAYQLRGRFQTASTFNTAPPPSGSQSARKPRSWHERRPETSANPFAYKASIDKGKLKVLSNWRQGFEGRGAERYANGELYVGDIKYGDRNGSGMYQHSGGQLLVSKWRQNEPIGEGVQWSADRKAAYRILDGRVDQPIPILQAKEIAKQLEVTHAPAMDAKKPATWGLSLAMPLSTSKSSMALGGRPVVQI